MNLSNYQSMLGQIKPQYQKKIEVQKVLEKYLGDL